VGVIGRVRGGKERNREEGKRKKDIYIPNKIKHKIVIS
jgi:hypothetical protein